MTKQTRTKNCVHNKLSMQTSQQQKKFPNFIPVPIATCPSKPTGPGAQGASGSKDTWFNWLVFNKGNLKPGQSDQHLKFPYKKTILKSLWLFGLALANSVYISVSRGRIKTYVTVHNIFWTHHILLSRWCLRCSFALQFTRWTTWPWFTMLWFLTCRSPTRLGLHKRKHRINSVKTNLLG